jgi:hypothetical protein
MQKNTPQPKNIFSAGEQISGGPYKATKRRSLH